MSNNNCPNTCDCTVCNYDDCMDNNMLITACCTNTEVVFQNEYATVIRTESTTVEMFPYADGYQYSLVNEDADFCVMNEDGSLTFSETGNVMVDVYDVYGSYVGRYRVSAILREDGTNTISIGYMGNCDDASDELNIYLCNAAGELLEYPEWYMRVGEEYQFRYRLRNATGYPEVTWSVSDTTILRVLNTGLVVAVREGEAVLTVSVGHVSCSLRIVVEGVAGSDVDITDYIIFNEFLIDESTMVNSPLYTGVTKGLACKYYIADVHDFVAARTESSAFEDHDSTCMTIWKESDRYGTNSVLCNGDQDLAAILVYDEENLQYNARMLDGETGKYLEKPTNGNSSHGWGLLVFRNDCVEPEIYTYKKYLEGDNDELPKKIGDIWLAMGGINLFADLADLTLEEKTLISNDILQKGDFDNYDEFRNTFVNLYKYWSYACKQDEAHRPRTAIGYNSIAQKVVLAIIFDGSNIDSHIIPDSGELGANLYDVRQIMKYLGCNKVLNLDGGGSTRISYKRHGIKRSCYVGSREIFADIFINPDRIENVLWAADA